MIQARATAGHEKAFGFMSTSLGEQISHVSNALICRRIGVRTGLSRHLVEKPSDFPSPLGLGFFIR